MLLQVQDADVSGDVPVLLEAIQQCAKVHTSKEPERRHWHRVGPLAYDLVRKTVTQLYVHEVWHL